MHIIVPVQIVDGSETVSSRIAADTSKSAKDYGIFQSSNVPERDYDEFDFLRAYDVNEYVIDTRGTEVLTLSTAPNPAWNVGDMIYGQTSTVIAVIVEKLTDLTYRIHGRHFSVESPSTSPSSSPSISASASPSLSPSASISPSISASESPSPSI